MKRLLALIPCLSVLLVAFACADDDPNKAGSKVKTQEPGVCHLADCPTPPTGVKCCTPDAECGIDATGMGFTCAPNPEVATNLECKLDDCAQPLIGSKCCTPTARCGWDPFASGLLCFPDAPTIHIPDGGLPELCPLDKCPAGPNDENACCQLNGQCGIDTLGVGLCFPPPPPPTCDLDACPKAESGVKSCCLPNGLCGFDQLGVGLCFPPPVQLCDLDSCPHPDGGFRPCCQLNGQCGIDSLGIGLCFPPPPEPTCDLKECPLSPSGVRSCCLPNGLCGFDSLGVGICFPPPPEAPDGGFPPVSTTPPDDPSVTGECPSFLGLFGPVWGCCNQIGVCGTFAADECLLAIGTPLPVGPPPPPEAGVNEPFLRCTPPPK